jgi:hypothetical protein
MKVWHSDITYMKQMSRAASGFELKTKLLRVIKCQFGFTKVRYKGLAKKAAELVALFGLSNLWMARRPLMGGGAGISPPVMRADTRQQPERAANRWRYA